MSRSMSWVDVSGREWTWVDVSGREWTWVDVSGREWTWVDVSGRQWTWVDVSGREWTWVDVSRRYVCYSSACDSQPMEYTPGTGTPIAIGPSQSGTGALGAIRQTCILCQEEQDITHNDRAMVLACFIQKWAIHMSPGASLLHTQVSNTHVPWC